MGRRSFSAISTAAAWGAAAALAVLPAGGPASAADLPVVVKAPPKSPDSGNPFWVEVDALGWSAKGDRPPALLTAIPTSVLFGDSAVNGGWRAGGQLQAGYWFDPQHDKGIELSFFDLQDRTSGIATNSAINPMLSRPFFNAATGTPDALLVAFPGLLTGSATVSETSRLLGAGALYRQEIGSLGGQRISALIGYRYLHSSDKLGIATTTILGPLSLSISDAFNATSDFHGVDLGIAGEWRRGLWSLEWRGKVALGANLTSSQIGGATTASFGGVTTTMPGGLLALSSNSGNTSQTRFSAVPEVSVKAGYQVAPQWQIVAGYDLLYWTGVQRAGGLIDTTVNPNLLPPATPGGPQRPQPLFNTSPLLAQGFNVGVRYNY
jgi:putative beta barrel porin BBP7